MLERAVKAESTVSSEGEILRIRLSLSGQAGDLLRTQAEAQFGLSYRWWEIHDRARLSLPRKFLHERDADAVALHSYTAPIPDAALLRFQAAKESGLFSDFFVVTAHYGSSHSASADPWLIGRIKDSGGDGSWVGNGGRFIVLAYWD